MYLRQIHKYKTSFNAISIGRAGKCVDDDDDDSGGRTQRDCLRLTAPWVRVILTEAKTNTVCICEQVFLGEDRLDFFRDFFAFLKFLTVKKC